MDIVCCVASSADEGTGCAGGVGGGAEGAAAPAAPAPYDAKVSAGELGSCGGEQGRVGGGRRLKGGAGACPRLHLPPGLRRAGRRTTAADAVHVRCGHGGLCADEEKSGGRITEGVDACPARLFEGPGEEKMRGDRLRGRGWAGGRARCAGTPKECWRVRRSGEGVGRSAPQSPAHASKRERRARVCAGLETEGRGLASESGRTLLVSAYSAFRHSIGRARNRGPRPRI